MQWNRTEKLAEELGEALAKMALHFCSPAEVAKFKKEFNLEEIENAEREYIYLVMFLTTYACQIAFLKNKKLAETILDSFDKYTIEKRFDLPSEILEARENENQLNKRFAQYYELSRTKEHNIDLEFLASQLPYDFFANVLEKDVNYVFNDKDFRQSWGDSTIKLSLLVGEVLTETTLAISRIKDKYKIEDKYRGKTSPNSG